MAAGEEATSMANQEHLDLLKQGVKVWNQWRQEHPDILPDLSGARLFRASLTGADLSATDFTGADLTGADFHTHAGKLPDARAIAEYLAHFSDKGSLMSVSVSGPHVARKRGALAGYLTNHSNKRDLMNVRAESRAEEREGTIFITYSANLNRANLSQTKLNHTNLAEVNLNEAN